MIKKFTFTKKFKLQKNSKFQVVYKEGKSYANRMMVLYVFSKPSETKVGFAAGKRLGGAVVRNRIKRLLREVYRLNQHRIKEGYHYILVGRQMMKSADFAATNKAFLDLCNRTRILK